MLLDSANLRYTFRFWSLALLPRLFSVSLVHARQSFMFASFILVLV